MPLKKIIILLLILSQQTWLTGQETPEYEVEKISLSFNKNGVILSDINPSGGYLITPYTADYISSWNLDNPEKNEIIRFLSSEFNFNDYKPTSSGLMIEPYLNIGTVSTSDTITVFCASTGGKSSIYSLVNGTSLSVILAAKGQTNYYHPFLSEDGSQLFFSSNLKSEIDNYDIFFLNKLADGWSKPVRLGAEINTPENQVYPTWYNDSLFYSTNFGEGLELMTSSKSSQYKSTEKLPAPFNSAKDDFLLHKKNNQIYYVTSNRDSKNDQVFVVTRKIQPVAEKMLISGYLACSGNRISNIPISLINQIGFLVDNDITDADGKFLLRANKVIKHYKLKLDKKDSRIKDCAVLYLTDINGNVIQKIVVNDEGEFVFEIINPDEVSGLAMKSVEDESLLQIELNGQIYENTPGDIGKGEPVSILSENGEMIALAYTSPEGKFQFSDLSPESHYKLMFDENSQQLKLNIIKDGEIIPISVENNEALYQRINEENSIELIDDRGKNITIEKDEFFNLQNIFYENNSSELSEIAKFQLDRFAKFIFNNDEITIELISHTDSKGTSTYNLELSEKRSQQAQSYLVSKGVQEHRLHAYGMGEKQLLNQCVNGVECSDSEHAVNRRTEIRIIVLE